jgi:hypothetical protein
MATVRCRINHKATKHTDKCSKNKTKRTQKKARNNREMNGKFWSENLKGRVHSEDLGEDGRI